jgi:hypothetical protein
MPGQPVEQALGVSDRCGQAHALQFHPGQFTETFQDRKQMPAPVITSEGMNLVNDHDAQATEQHLIIRFGRDQHHLQGFWRRQQTIREIRQDLAPSRLAYVAVPEFASAAGPPAITVEARMQIVQQRLQRAQIEDAQAFPVLTEHAGQHRKKRGFRFAPRRRSQQQDVPLSEDGTEAFFL